MASLNGSELLIKVLEAQAAGKIFSIPGGQLIAAYEAVRKSEKLELIVPRQEGASALMACGYSLAKGDPGVVISTVGAGVVYELAGLVYAFEERVPLISIAPQVQSWRIKPIQENLQAIDQDELYAPLTKFHSIIYHYDRIPQVMNRACRVAMAAEPGPVHVDLPLDVLFQAKSMKTSRLEALISKGGNAKIDGNQAPDPAEMDKATRLITRANRPMALLGRMLTRGKCSGPLAAFLEKAGIPALSSTPGFSALPPNNKLFLGTTDLYDNEDSRALISQADLLLYLEPDEEVISFVKKIPRLPAAVQLSSYAPLLHSFAPVSSALSGTPGLVLELLQKGLQPKQESGKDNWLEQLSREKLRVFQAAESNAGPGRQSLRHSFEMINRVAGAPDCVVCEGAEPVAAAKLYLDKCRAGRVILIPESLPAGAGFPLALGIKAGAEAAKVFLLTDRGNFKYHCRELQTQARYRMGICSLVFPEQEPLAKTEPDLAALALSLGVKGLPVREPVEEISEKLLSESAEAHSGALLEIRGF